MALLRVLRTAKVSLFALQLRLLAMDVRLLAVDVRLLAMRGRRSAVNLRLFFARATHSFSLVGQAARGYARVHEGDARSTGALDARRGLPRVAR